MKKQNFAVLLIVLVSVTVFANSMGNRFVYDDLPFIVDNTAIRSLANAPSFFISIKSFSQSGNFYIYRPLSTLSYAVDYSIAKLNPSVFHLSSLIWHVVVCIMLYFTAKLMLGEPGTALLATLLFSLHPVQTESVAWVAQRSNLISLFFFLLSIYLWLYKPGRRILSVLSLLSFCLALLGKEMAISLPVILILYDVSHRKFRGWKSYFPFFLASAYYIIIRTIVLGRLSGQNEFAGGSIYKAALTTANVLMYYVRLLVLPVRLCADYNFPSAPSLLDARLLISIVLLIALLCWGISLLSRRKKEGFFILWFFATLLPVSNLVPMQKVVLAERFLYFPSIGFCILLAMLILRAGREKKTVLLFLSLLPMIFYASLTINRNRVWKDGLSLWSETVSRMPDNYRAFCNLGTAYTGRGRYDEAIESFRESIRLNSSYAEAYYNMGLVYMEQGKFEEAISFFRQALSIYPSYAEPSCNLGVVYGRCGRRDDAVAFLKEALRLNPDYVLAYYNLGLLCGKEGRYEESLEHFKQAVRIDPCNAEAYYCMGIAYIELARYNEAIESLKTAVFLNPSNPSFRYNLGTVYALTGNRALASEQLDALKNLDEDTAGRLYAVIGN